MFSLAPPLPGGREYNIYQRLLDTKLFLMLRIWGPGAIPPVFPDVHPLRMEVLSFVEASVAGMWRKGSPSMKQAWQEGGSDEYFHRQWLF